MIIVFPQQTVTDQVINSDPVQLGPSFNACDFYINQIDWNNSGQSMKVCVQHSDDGANWEDIVTCTVPDIGTQTNILYGYAGLHGSIDPTDNSHVIYTIPSACQARLHCEVHGSITYSITEGGF